MAAAGCGRDHRGIGDPLTRSEPAPPRPVPQTGRRRGGGRLPLRRSRDDRMIAGIAGGLSRRLGIDATVVRLALVLLALVSGFGIAAYVLCWLVVPFDGDRHSIAARATTDRRGIALALAMVPLMVVVLTIASVLSIPYLSTVTWAIFASAACLVLVFRNADHDEKEWLRQAIRPLVHISAGPAPRRAPWLRVGAGLGLLIAGLLLMVLAHSKVADLRLLGGVALAVSAVVVLFGPWWLRLVRDLIAERQARARAEERADMAARVHDSVLQTLALIQRSAGDPQRVTQLARTQERELRAWLLDGSPPGPLGRQGATELSTAIEQIAKEAEALHGTMVENVTVGDCALTDRLDALVSATREATLNAARWSKAPVVSIFAEVEQGQISVFVRDRGVGFDPRSIPRDRRGVSESIVGRMERHGGSARIRSAPAGGTEIQLVLPAKTGRA